MKRDLPGNIKGKDDLQRISKMESICKKSLKKSLKKSFKASGKFFKKPSLYIGNYYIFSYDFSRKFQVKSSKFYSELNFFLKFLYFLHLLLLV